MIIATWNIRGLQNLPTQAAVVDLVKKHKIDVMGILETKFTTENDNYKFFLQNNFRDWKAVDNFAQFENSRILLLWNPNKVELEPTLVEEQAIYARIRCLTSNNSFNFILVYGAHTIPDRRPLWDSLIDHVLQDQPTLLSGDFNNVLAEDERVGGVPPREFEIKNMVDTCALLGLEDIMSTGCKFTWTNRTISSKIDRAMVNEAWFSKGYLATTDFLPSGAYTDHSPAVTTLFGNVVSFPKPFKFFNFWLKHAGFNKLVEENWATEVRGTAQFVLAERGKKFKVHLKDFNFKEFSEIAKRAKEAADELDAMQKLADVDTANIPLRNQIIRQKKKTAYLQNSEREYYVQKAKFKHSILSDRCTSFFHSLVKRNNSRNYIAFLHRSDGSVTWDQEVIIKDFVDYFSTLLGTKKQATPIDLDILRKGALVSDDDCKDLVRPITDEEIKAALFDIGNDKAPGPDGYSSAFFKKQWNRVGNDIIRAVKEFFDTGQLLKSFNTTVVSLIPKTANCPKVGDFRPISCCNVFYKIITKILSARMTPLLGKLVDLAQSAFIPGRSIMDNIHLVQELMRGYENKKNAPKCAIKIDLRKAYDTVDWDFLRSILHGLNLHPKFVFWVMQCVTSPRFSIAINGSPHGFFQGKRGLRQGDPMSPTLFIFCMEYLSRLLAARTTGSNFNYHARCAREKITHVAFADDLMLFGRGDYMSMEILSNTMEEFSSCSGLEINRDKSNIFAGGKLPNRDLEEIKTIFGFPIGILPVRYLGVPLESKKLNIMHYSPLIEKIAANTKKWTGKNLSYAGKTELIRSVLQGVSCYWLQVFPLPANVRDRITSLCRVFLWGTPYGRIGWKDLCLPKDEGGLGFRDLGAWNKALLARNLWNIHVKKDSLWIKWIHSEFLINRTIWDWRAKPRESPLFKRLLEIRDTLLADLPRREVINLFGKWYGTKGAVEAYDWFRPRGEKRLWHRFVWKEHVPPKYSFTTWQALKGRLPTRDRLGYLNIDQQCPLCLSGTESVDHLFFKCDKTRAVWREIKTWLGLRRIITTIPSAIKWIGKERSGVAVIRKARSLALISMVSLVWRARNAFVFDRATFDPKHLVFEVKRITYSILYSMYTHELVLEHLGV